MTTPFENFVNIALGKSVSADVTLPTADDIPVFTGIGRQVTGKTIAELGLALSTDLDTDGTLAANSDTKYPSQKAVKTYADTKQAALADVITANTYGSATQYPVITFNAKGIATEVTLQTVVSPAVFSDSTFRIQDNDNATKQLAFEVSGVATATTRTLTVPNANINLGNLSSVATTDSNTLSGTRNRILGGSGNTVSGIDNIAIGCNSATLSGARQTAIGAKLNAAITCNNAIVLGSANDGYSVTVRHPLFKHPNQTLLISRAEGDYDYTTSLAHSPKAFLTQGAFGASRHTLTFIAMARNAALAGIGSITGSRIFSVRYDDSAYSVSSIDTPVADSATGDLSITFAVSLVTVSGIRVLEIVPTVTGSGVSTHSCYATLESLYMY